MWRWIKVENYIFLLGGKDLEMEEIKKILKSHNVNFIDNNLSWGAKLSDYKNELKEVTPDKIIVGIELTNDIKISNKYILIDHHNENSRNNSSIEQIAEMLDIKLNRYQKLVAENDKGYIQAMMKAGASEKEIEIIRKNDRKAQGVTKKDEKLAEKSIKNNKQKMQDVIIIRALTDKFSPIVDRLYPASKIIVYNKQELNYYGEHAMTVAKKIKDKYKDYNIYYGGGENGFMGIIYDSLGKEDIMNIIDKIVQYVRK